MIVSTMTTHPPAFRFGSISTLLARESVSAATTTDFSLSFVTLRLIRLLHRGIIVVFNSADL